MSFNGRLAGEQDTKDYNYHSLQKDPIYNGSKNELIFNTGNYLNVIQSKFDLGKLKTVFSFRSPYRYNSNLKIESTRSVSDIKLNDYGATLTSDIDQKIEQNYRRLYAAYNKYLNKEDCKPSEAKAKIIGDLNKSLKNCLELEIEGIGDVTSGEGTIYFTKKDHKDRFEFNVLSSGEKEVVDILLDLYLRQEEFNDTIFLIDEPELHINTSIQKKLLLEINKLIGEDCQIWIATHSIGFLRALQDELKDECQIIQFENGKKWASEKQIILPMKKSLAKWKDIFETALDDLTDLISPKRLIYCEGKDKPGRNGQENGFDAKVFNNIFGEKYHDTLFISSGGNTELDTRSEIGLALLSKVFSEIKILVLKDRDSSSGKKTSSEDRDLYLENNGDNHRMLKRWEIENYLYDKEVLAAYCQDKRLKFDEASYDELVENVVDDNLKDNYSRIRKICGIETSISRDKFGLNLSNYMTSEMHIYKKLEECIFT